MHSSGHGARNYKAAESSKNGAACVTSDTVRGMCKATDSSKYGAACVTPDAVYGMCKAANSSKHGAAVRNSVGRAAWNI